MFGSLLCADHINSPLIDRCKAVTPLANKPLPLDLDLAGADVCRRTGSQLRGCNCSHMAADRHDNVGNTAESDMAGYQ
ncbi:hypothetical protein A5634_22155 [Mycobacterium asiaticum]|uniref:Uncharacterized protein n=1 Tax=Mycobacterium asiaticum TaxID=1790 RepID=A0A1A3P0P9_MYCAS|nr:hypothetical protein A5634_22155 [Mycobacterium asiaticum]